MTDIGGALAALKADGFNHDDALRVLVVLAGSGFLITRTPDPARPDRQRSIGDPPVTDAERREYRQALDNLNRLIGWLEQHGVGQDVAVRSTVAEHEARITALEAKQ